MRRLAPLLVPACAALSLLLCVGTCVLWVRSYRLTDSVSYSSAAGFWGVCSASGDVVAQLNPGDPQGAGPAPAWYGWHYTPMYVYTAPSYPVAYGHLGPTRSYGTSHFGPVDW